jgi:serine/threonine protein kinase
LATNAALGPLRVEASLGNTAASHAYSAVYQSTAPTGPTTGLRLGRYRLIERLGRGCQGQVWRALQVEPIIEEVALKLLTPEQAHNPGWRSQFHREARWGGGLADPALLPVHEFGDSEGYLFLAMPLVDGDTLAAVIERRRRHGGTPPPFRRHWLDRLPRDAFVAAMLAVVARVARGAAAAHAERVVHRDIKPANILVDRKRPEGVFLCDFGLGRDLDDHATAPLRGSTGTPLYMAPERLLGQPADEMLCDVYSLGATLAEAVTLVPPFSVPEGLPSPEWPEFLARSNPRRPSDVAPWLSPTLVEQIERAMCRDPRQRYPSMTALAEALGR